jgi:hypothetical protein
MNPNQKSGRMGRLIRRALLLIFTLVLMAAIGAGLVLNKIFTGPSPAARNALVLKMSQSESTRWIPTVFLDSEEIAQILADNDSGLSGTDRKEG